MNIDPRVMKELLQLQLLNKMSLISGGSGSSDDAGTDFSALLETVMSQAGAQGEGVGSSLDELSGSSLASLLSSYTPAGATSATSKAQIPASLYALNKSYSPLQSLGRNDASSQYDSLINEASSRFGVDPALVKAVIDQESDFNSNAVSSAGAKGLMQLMDGTARGFGVSNSFDPQQNVHAGTQFLSNLIKKYNGNEGVALAAYNAGPGRVDRLGIRTDADLAEKLHLLPKETQAYVGKVKNLWQTYAN